MTAPPLAARNDTTAAKPTARRLAGHERHEMRAFPASQRGNGALGSPSAATSVLHFIPDRQVWQHCCGGGHSDLIVQRASARGTAMASSPSRKRSDGGSKTGDEDTIRKQSEAVYCQVSGPLGRLRNQVKTREGERRASIFGSLGSSLMHACVLFPSLIRLEASGWHVAKACTTTTADRRMAEPRW